MYQRWLQFFEPLESDPALKRAIQMGKAEILARLKLIEMDAGAIKL